MKIEINLKNVSREEISELKKYLEANCWDWKQNKIIINKSKQYYKDHKLT